MADLISRRMLRPFEDACAQWGTIGKVAGAFWDEHFEPAIEPDLDDNGDPHVGTRRGTFHDNLTAVDLSKPGDVRRLLRVLETILSWIPEHTTQGVLGSGIIVEHPDRVSIREALQRDGFNLSQAGAIEGFVVPHVSLELPLGELRDPMAIEEHLDRLAATGDEDPPLAISSAKAIVEATCKHVLEELGESYNDKADLPALVRAVQKALKIHPDNIAPSAKGRESIVRTLSSLSQTAIGLAELRNEYGPDHGRTRDTTGLGPRHAHLATGVSQTFCRFLLETLRDRRATGQI